MLRSGLINGFYARASEMPSGAGFSNPEAAGKAAASKTLKPYLECDEGFEGPRT